MFISHKSNTIQQVHESEWQCRRMSKGLSKPEYWAWEATITSGDPPVITYPSEDFSIVECTDEDVWKRLAQLYDYVSNTVEGKTYNIKYYVNKRNAEEILDSEGKSYDPKQYVSSHFVPDDTAKDKRILDQKWANIRSKRNRLLTESDWVDYRTELRDITKQSDPDDITWPTKPS